MTHFPPFSADSHWLEQLIQSLPSARVAVFGDLFLDAYWLLDSAPSEKSVETGLAAYRVKGQRYSAGGGGNVAVNIAAFGVKHVDLIGLAGKDLFGEELMRQFVCHGLPIGGVLRVPSSRQTLVYAKPYQGETELNRFDFVPDNTVPPEAERELIGRLDAAAASCPVVVINQQVPGGWPATMVDGINELIARRPDTLFIVDSRDHADRFSGAALKLNLREAARVLGEKADEVAPEDALRLASALEARQRRPALVTRGEDGLALAVKGELFDIPGIELPGRTDPVGAGDTALAALAAAFAVGASPLHAGMFANLAAAITTHQLRTTGVATPVELRAVGSAPDYVHSPRLAAQPGLARYLPGTDIEIVSVRRPPRNVRHAIFDHDGTVSVLRQGWEQIMQPMMESAITGDRWASIGDKNRALVTGAVRDLIDRTTGIQTLAQMKDLVDLVRQFGFVAPDAILDEHGYKAIFNRDLLALVRRRVTQLERGELSPLDWQIKNARQMLEQLHDAGITLYLASGTDESDAVAEAKILGYAHLFSGGIFGAVGDLRVEAKRDVLARIVRATGVGGGEIVVVGDGPVEMREARRNSAFAVGVASDEVRRHGADMRKRTRLIRAGADLIIPDFCQSGALLKYLGIG